MTIPFTLAHIARRRKDLPFNWIFLCFAVFIVACGLTHAMEVWNLWHAAYWLAGLLKATTAAASVATAVLLVQLVPQALQLPSANDLREANETLKSQGAAVRASEVMFRGLLESAPDAMVIADAQGRIVLVNAQTELLFGYPRDELIGQLVEILMPERFRGTHSQHRKDYTAHPRARKMGADLDLWGLRKDHSEFPLEISLSPIETAEGTLISSAIRDVTTRQQAQTALHQCERRFRGIVESAPDAMVITDAQGRIILVNAETERMFGYRREELLGQLVEFLVPHQLRAQHPQHREGYTAHPRTRLMGEGLELRGLRKDASEFPVEISLSPLKSAEGTLVTASIRDITKRKQAEAELQQSEERLSLLFRGAKDYAIFTLDPQGRVTNWNEGAERIEGYRAAEIIGQNFSRFYQPEAIAQQKPAQELDFAADRGSFTDEGWRVRMDGSIYWASVVITALHDNRGQLRGFGKLIHDITERRAAQEQLEKTVVELQRSNNELQQFAYVASHDLQEPLRMVASYTQLMAQRYTGQLDADADEFMAFAVDGAVRMQGMIRDLLAYSRAGTEGKAPREISSESALQVALTNLQATIKESGAVVTHDALPAIVTDDAQLVQVLQNLIANAIKYRSAETPRVHVSAAKNGGQECIFSVRDNGLGIDPRYFEKIFVLFQRLHGQKEFQGTGIGLTICKKIVERLGGRIWVQSALGSGSTFLFALPDGGVK
jgi:PAS domain S-box-containing protein